jgi:hypothetical protein
MRTSTPTVYIRFIKQYYQYPDRRDLYKRRLGWYRYNRRALHTDLASAGGHRPAEACPPHQPGLESRLETGLHANSRTGLGSFSSLAHSPVQRGICSRTAETPSSQRRISSRAGRKLKSSGIKKICSKKMLGSDADPALHRTA